MSSHAPVATAADIICYSLFIENSLKRRLRKGSAASDNESEAGTKAISPDTEDEKKKKHTSWQRILLLIIAITVHNIPGT